MRIAILLMQKNESSLLSSWFYYHANLIGSANIFIYDNGSTDENTQIILKTISHLGANVFYDKSTTEDFSIKGPIISDKIKSLDHTEDYDFYFPMDCDEFLSVNIDGKFSCDINDINKDLKNFEKSRKVLLIGCTLDNSPIHKDYFLENRVQRKCFFASKSCKFLDNGFHDGSSVEGKDFLISNITYIHMHYRGYYDYVYYSKQKLINRISEYSVKALKDAEQKKIPGFHLIPNLLSNKSAYDSQFDVSKLILFDGLSNKLSSLNLGDIFEYYVNKREPCGFIEKIERIDNLLKIKGWFADSSGNGPTHLELMNSYGDSLLINTSSLIREDVKINSDYRSNYCGFEVDIILSNFNLVGVNFIYLISDNTGDILKMKEFVY
jgi:hypothetical protein